MKTIVKSLRMTQEELDKYKELASENMLDTSQTMRELIKIGYDKVMEHNGDIKRCRNRRRIE